MKQLDMGNLKQLETFGAFLRKLESRGQSKLIFPTCLTFVTFTLGFETHQTNVLHRRLLRKVQMICGNHLYPGIAKATKETNQVLC